MSFDPFKFKPREQDKLVTLDSSGFINGEGPNAPELKVFLGPYDKVGRDKMDVIESGKMKIATVHHLNRISWRWYLVHDIYIVDFSIGNFDEYRN